MVLQLTETEKSERGFGLGKILGLGFRHAKFAAFWVSTDPL
jgi:hypothetical protein